MLLKPIILLYQVCFTHEKEGDQPVTLVDDTPMLPQDLTEVAAQCIIT